MLVKKFEAVPKYRGKKAFARMPNVSKNELTIWYFDLLST
jgi:hypothetical protein